MTVFILPTVSPVKYRGKYPTRARSISGSARNGTGRHIELNDGTRLWSGDDRSAEYSAGALNDDYATVKARAVPMSAEQYATLREAAELSRTRVQIAGRARRERLESDVRAIVESIKPDARNYAKRNAEAARRETLAGETGRGFDADRPFRVRNRTPQFSGSFDFATLEEARAYLAAQLARRDSVVSGAAPVGPDANSQCPLESFILWAEGTETLGDMGWTPPSDGGARWSAPAAPATAEPEVAFVVYVGSDGVPALCEGGVYSSAPRGDYAGNTLEEAAKVAAGHNGASFDCSAFKVYTSAEGVYVDAEVAGSLEAWQLDILEAQPLRLTSLGNVRTARRRFESDGKPIRRDNVEYHAGRKARRDGVALEDCPYLAGGDRAARWNLGWSDADASERDAEALRLAESGPYIVAGRSVDGTEYLTPMGWSGDYRAALLMSPADAREIAEREEKQAAATRNPDNGIYQIKPHVWSGPCLYTVAEYESDQAEEARLEAYLSGAEPAFRFDFDRLSGTGIIVRLADDLTSLRYTGEEAERLRGVSAEELAAEAVGVEFS